MTDLSDLLTRKHKIPGNEFGKILQPRAVHLRLKQLKVHRRQQRNSLLDERRQMPDSPCVENCNFTKKDTANEEKVNKLKLWQQKRNEERAEQRRKQQPAFKVCRVPDFIPMPESKMVKDSKMATFAPTNHKFNPPKNIKPQQFINRPVTRSRLKIKLPANNVAASEPSVITTSRGKTTQKPLEHLKPKALCEINLNKELAASEKLYNLPSRPIVTRSVKKQPLSPQEMYVQNSCDEPSTSSSTRLKPGQRRSQEKISQDSDSDQEVVTAENSCSTPAPVYMSQFITLSRGKDNQTNEYLYRRKSTTGVDTPSPKSVEKLKNVMSSTTPKAAARYFTKVLDNTIADIQKLCDQWRLHREETTVDEPCNMIDVAVGQSQLLINNKFKQFRILINQCELQTEKITCEDLHGFWDMLFIQVDNLQKRFDNLTTLRNNNWIEILPKPQATKRPKRQPAKAKAGSSCVRNAILKAKQTMNVQNTSTTAPRRSSGLIIMVATQNLKTVTPQKVQAPYRSILKNHNSESSLSKSVVFDEKSEKENDLITISSAKGSSECSPLKSVAFDDESEKENDLITFSSAKVETNVRRSTRQTRTKLF